MSDTCEHAENEAWRHPECGGCRHLNALAFSRGVSAAGRALAEMAPAFGHALTGHRVDRLIIDDPHQAYPLLDPDVDLSNILATRAVLADFDEQFCDGSGDPTVRAALVAQLVGEVLPLARTEEQRDAVRMSPRSGLWLGSDLADGRELTQTQTDAMVRFELWRTAGLEPTSSHRVVRDVVGEPFDLEFSVVVEHKRYVTAHARAISQRAGIDSDPLVRLLAFRTWGARDMHWGDVELDINGDVVPSLQWAARNATPIDDVIAGIMRAREDVGLPPRVTMMRFEDHDQLSQEFRRRRDDEREVMRASTRRDRLLPPVPKWAKAKRSRAGRPGR